MMQCVCDICGKVIPNNTGKYMINISCSGSLPLGCVYNDVCVECTNKIESYISTMKRGSTKHGVKSTNAGTEVPE